MRSVVAVYCLRIVSLIRLESYLCGRKLLMGTVVLTASGLLGAQQPANRSPAHFYAQNPQLEEYVLEALQQNPTLRESLARYRAALQEVPQGSALPDPMLSFTQFIHSVETRVGPQMNSFMLSQKLPWFGKLDLRGQIAFKQAMSLYELHRAQEREIIAQVKRSFYDLAYVDRALEINEEEQLLLEHYEQLAQVRYATGQGMQQAVIRIQAEITRVLNRWKILNQQRGSLVARLNTLRDQPPEGTLPTVGGLDMPRLTLDLQELYEMGERNRQELRAALAEIEKNEQSIHLAKKDYWPDVTLSVGMINVGGRDDPAALLMPPPEAGKNAYNFSVGINIPIRRRKYDARLLQATEGLVASRERYLKIRNEMELAIQDQVLQLQTLLEQVDLFEGVLIPQAEEALRSTESAYETGQIGALDLLDSERVLLNARLVHARYGSDYLRSLADLERALGTQFPK